MKIGIGNDHHGYKLKKELVTYLKNNGYEVCDFGSDNEDIVDYPIYAFKVGEAVRDKKVDLGILICGTGIGMSIACNKVRGIRCGKVSTVEEARLTKEHNCANVIAISESIDKPFEVVSAFLTTPYSDVDRYLKRSEMTDNYDN